MSVSKDLLSAEKLSAGYGRKIVIDSLDFRLRAGETVTIIGANGAGKSTLLRTISAQLPAVSGKILIDGREISDMTPNEIARKISVMLTERVSTDRMTCEDVVSSGRYPFTGRLGILSDADREAVSEAMELTGTAELRERDFRLISDGQRQIVMLARALAQQPKIMLLDEPTSYLDIENKLKILSMLRKTARERNISVIQTLHELDLAQKFSDRIISVANGKAERTGTPDEIFSGGYIEELFGMESGIYDTYYGTAEPFGADGEPQVFVIGGGGSGINTYRELFRRGIPFAAGVIHENDTDHSAAAALAAETVIEKAYEPVSQVSIEKAKALIDRCRNVICCQSRFGSMNSGNYELKKYAGTKLAGSVNEITLH